MLLWNTTDGSQCDSGKQQRGGNLVNSPMQRCIFRLKSSKRRNPMSNIKLPKHPTRAFVTTSCTDAFKLFIPSRATAFLRALPELHVAARRGRAELHAHLAVSPAHVFMRNAKNASICPLFGEIASWHIRRRWDYSFVCSDSTPRLHILFMGASPPIT